MTKQENGVPQYFAVNKDTIPRGVNADAHKFVMAMANTDQYAGLDVRLRHLLDSYFIKGINTPALAVEQGVSRVRVSQLLSVGIRKLHNSSPEDVKSRFPMQNIERLSNPRKKRNPASLIEAEKRAYYIQFLKQSGINVEISE